MTMKVFEQLVVGALQCNCYLVGDPVTLQAIVIDPGDDPDAILAAADRHGLSLVAAVATHAHFDHVLAAEAIRQRTGIPFYLHAGDLPVFPGHGPPTTIGQERLSNPFVGSNTGLWTPGG